MKISSICLLTTFGVANVAASAQGEATMERLMGMKVAQREQQRAQGWFAGSRLYKKLLSRSPCINGKAAGTYSCNNIDMYSFLSHEDMGSTTKEGNDIWGWTAPNGREFAAVGQTDGTAFVEIDRLGRLDYIGRLPTQTEPSIWRDMKVIDGYCYIGSEAAGHGLQVFDMRKLLKAKPRSSSPPVVFDINKDLTAWFNGFGSSHNIVAHEEKKMIYAVGTGRKTPCAGGLFMVDVSNPARPTSPGCANEDGYVHDAQCVVYKGPDSQFNGREICFNYNEDTLTIMDVTNKAAPKIISRTPYTGAAYTHQGWVVDMENMDFLLLDDELDETDGTNPGKANHTTTYLWDISSLSKPVNTGIYQSPAQSIDHNQYVRDGITFQANYGSGLRMVDVSSKDRTGKKFKEVGFFDVHPEDDATNGEVEFTGSWSVYPYFPSKFIVVNSIERGVFALRYNPRPGWLPW